MHSVFLDTILVRMFRLWAHKRAARTLALPAMSALSQRLGLPLPAAMACASLFELVEGQIGRPLVAAAGDADAAARSPDERAIVLLVENASGLGPATGSVMVPHGLPGAVCWAARVVRETLGAEAGPPLPPQPARAGPPPSACPFVPPPRDMVPLGL